MSTEPSIAIPEKILRAFATNSVLECLRFIDELPLGTRNIMRDRSGQTLVHLAAASKSVELLLQLISPDKRNMPVSVVDLEGNHPLHIAAAHGRVEHGRALLERGVNPLVLNGMGETAIAVALKNGCDHFATFLSKLAEPHTVEQLHDKWPLSVRLIDPHADPQLCWREVEGLAHLRIAPPLKPFPWTALEKGLEKRCAFGFLSRPPQMAAGMLLIDDEFQFDGMYFIVKLDVLSPHGTGTQVIVYESATPPICFLELFVSRSMGGYCVLRLYAAPTRRSAGDDYDEGALSDFRCPLPQESRFLDRCGPVVRQALLSLKISTLHEASLIVCRAYRRWSNVRKFRQVMLKLMNRLSALRAFLRNTVLSKRLAVVATCLLLERFERYAVEELGEIESSIYPAVRRCIVTTSAKRDEIVRRAIRLAKLQHLEHMRRSNPSGATLLTAHHHFSYLISIDSLIPVWVESMDVTYLSTRLLARGSSLPRATLLLLHKQNSPVSVEKMARRRLVSILREMRRCYAKRISYAADIIRQVEEDEVITAFQMEQQMERVREKRLQAAMSARAVQRLSAPHPRRCASNVSPHTVSDVTPLRPAHSFTNASSFYSTVGGTSRTSSARGMVRAQRCALVCDSRSPIPRVIGDRALLGQLLLHDESV